MLAPAREYDLAIIGGGPGGSTAAALGRLASWRVLVVEKARFPRFRIGESLLPMGNAIMRETGVWPKVAAAGFVPKYGAVFHTADGSVTQEVPFDEGLVPGLESTFQVERSRFDALLLDHARELGADVLMETRATRLAGSPRLRLESADGAREVEARWIFDAGGRNPAGDPGEPPDLEPAALPRRIAIYSHFTGVPRAPGPVGGHTIVVRLEDGWFWLIPIDAERTSVGLVTTAEAVRRSGAEPELAFHRAVAASAKLAEAFVGAKPAMDFQVTSDYRYFHRKLAGERFLRIGDAAGFFDPIFSSGVYFSMWSARLAVEHARRADAAGRGLRERDRRRYTTAVKRHARTFERLIAAFYDNRSFEVFMAQGVPFGLWPGLCSIVAGHARLTWPLWWRFQAFRAACAVHRRIPLVARLDLPPGLAPANAHG